MLEKPNLPDETLISALMGEYGMESQRLEFLPIGADINTAVYRVDSTDGKAYFLKLRKGPVNHVTVALPAFLSTQGIQAVIPPLKTLTGKLWAEMHPYSLILSPFIEGKDGYQVSLTKAQWVEFGITLRDLHCLQIPANLASLIPNETFSSEWRKRVRDFQANVEHKIYHEPAAKELAASMNEQREIITRLVDRTEDLAKRLLSRPLEMVLCHSDIHPGNLHITPDGAVYIVDWDTPIFAPKERDLMLIGGCSTWSNPRDVISFYEGYGKTPIDTTALAYYRGERIIWDIAAFCEQLLLSNEGGSDREQALVWFNSNFLPGHEIELALNTDPFPATSH